MMQLKGVLEVDKKESPAYNVQGMHNWKTNDFFSCIIYGYCRICKNRNNAVKNCSHMRKKSYI